ncbi:hypothetical protein HPP92_019996 [Vanilla planifolia]|uniref:Uncharacterized protein n=1 Tax=Vanilla planifolia TaxID=51239 RepID=A0A835ULA2_VANPL|nr:hypothetical protein HPP92_019996 [Vanilla planifolia]
MLLSAVFLIANTPTVARSKGFFDMAYNVKLVFLEVVCSARRCGICCNSIAGLQGTECHVPRCRDLKEHLKRLQQQSESRRRAAVMEMMRQRAAELQAIDD